MVDEYPRSGENMDAGIRSRLDGLLEEGKKRGRLPSRQLIDTLDAIEADKETVERFYDELEAAGVEIDVSDVLEVLGDSIDPPPTDQELQEMEGEELDLEEDAEVLADGFKMDDPVRMYLKEIGKIPLLSPEQEQALAQRMVDGDQEAQKQMAEANLRLVVSIAKRYVGRGMLLDRKSVV